MYCRVDCSKLHHTYDSGRSVPGALRPNQLEIAVEVDVAHGRRAIDFSRIAEILEIFKDPHAGNASPITVEHDQARPDGDDDVQETIGVDIGEHGGADKVRTGYRG